jgi:hypothetical protein
MQLAGSSDGGLAYNKRDAGAQNGYSYSVADDLCGHWRVGDRLEEMKTILGGTAGGLLGYLFRPSVPLLGQLPFEVVVTRGQNLHGLDVVLRGVAEQSFNYIVVGVVIGCLAGFVLDRMTQTTGGN